MSDRTIYNWLRCHLLLLASTLLFGLMLIWLFRGNVVPIIPDEIGYLSISKYLATGEIMNLSAIAPYRFGKSIILLPAFFVGSTNAHIYQIGVALSCIETSLIPIVFIGLAKRLRISPNWKIVAISVLVAIFPSYFYQNSVVWPETTLRLFFLLLIYLFASAWATRRWAYWMGSSVCSAWLYALHPRSIGVIPVLVAAFWIASTNGRMNRSTALTATGMLIVLVLLVNATQQHFLSVLWAGNKGDSGQIASLVANLLSTDGLVRLLAIALGHAWSLIASSFGLLPMGLFSAWVLGRANSGDRPVLLFALASSVAIFAASALQMVSFSRIDHLIYARYNDAHSSFFVWLALVSVTRSLATPLMASLIIVGSLAFTGIPLLFLARGFSLNGIVPPNLPAFIWTNYIVPFHATTLFNIVALGSLAALAVGLAYVFLPRVVALGILMLAVILSDMIIIQVAWQGHRGREIYLEKTRSIYKRATGSLFWDRSAAAYGDIVIDQYASVSKPMRWSNISNADINQGDSTVVGELVSKQGYSCIARLPNKAKLLVRAPGPDNC